ncbi:DUF5696 domain-containing protein [Haloplasma contractile]|uniref:Uncharacterized protein n=1 Tax=Haloplasma contractile SSD-17B TaxID=1033810 RepID=U2DXS8_9MOLU|nr:DUF5696 domain-containing protein [Haloplasma contractile]ERJ13062.1 hypothetical protein HLPCO_000671 [Haloplasma contractile SSD-17B]
MKKLVVRSLVAIALIVSSFIVINAKDNEVDYTVSTGKTLSGKDFMNNYITNQGTGLKEYNIEIPDRFLKVAANDYLELYLEEETLAIAIRNVSNGYVWFSYDVTNEFNPEQYSEEIVNKIKSGVYIDTYNKFAPATRTLFETNSFGDRMVDIQYKKDSNGFVATVDFTHIMIKFDVHVKLDGEDLVIEVPRESVQEYDPKLWTPGNTDISLSNIYVYPYLGSTMQEENGYVVIPDGSGAIVGLKEEPKFNLDYSAFVYGQDAGYMDEGEESELKVQTVKPLERVTLPIYGIIHDVGNTGLLVVSESGENFAQYNYTSKGGSKHYYQSYFIYNYRATYKQFQSRTNEDQHILGFQPETNDFDLKQRYVFLSGDEADYVGLAKKYRQKLEEGNGFSNEQVKRELNYPMQIDMIGNEITNGIFFEKYVPTTTYKEAIDIIEALKDTGYENLAVTYKTFNKDESAYRFDVYKGLGNKDELESMIKYLNNEDVDFNYYVDYLKSYNNNKYTASKMNKRALSTFEYTRMYLYGYINDVEYLPTFIENDLDRYNEYDIDSLAFDSLSHVLFTSKNKNEIRYRNENVAFIYESLEKLNQNGISTNLYNPDAYLYKYTNEYYDAPITSSEFMYIDATIPLVQLITSGHMNMYSPHLNFISNESNTLLRLVEYGINPSYLLTGKNAYHLKRTNSSDVFVSEYKVLKDRIARYDAFIEKGLNAVNGLEMVDHSLPQSGVSVSEFSDGTNTVTVIVNYNTYDIEYNGTTVEAKGYDVL